MEGGSENPFSTPFTGSITAKIGGYIMPIIDNNLQKELYFNGKRSIKIGTKLLTGFKEP